MRKSFVCFPPLRAAVPFFNPEAFKPKTDIRVTAQTLIPKFKEYLGNDTYRNSVFVRKGTSYLIVTKGKVCGIYTPILCLPPPLAHTAMATEEMTIKGGLSVAQYIDCLESLDDSYRSFMFFSMHNGCLLYTMDKEGRLPADSSLGPWYSASRTLQGPSSSRPLTEVATTDDGADGSSDGHFTSRYAESSTSTLAATNRSSSDTNMMMQAGRQSTYFQDLLDRLENNYESEIDKCPTWWRRVAVVAAAGSRDIPLIDRLANVSRGVGISRRRDEEGVGEAAGPAFPMDMKEDKRWTQCPSTDMDPRKFINEATGVINKDYIQKRMAWGFLKLDF